MSMDREKERVMCELTFLFGCWERLERRHQEPEVDHTERGQLMKHGPEEITGSKTQSTVRRRLCLSWEFLIFKFFFFFTF